MKKIFKSILNFFKENYLICIVLLIDLILHILAIIELGFNYNINSDDIGYIVGGITFYQTGQITRGTLITAQIMPGLNFLIAFMAIFFGTQIKLIIALKILWLIMGLCTIWVVYKTIRLFANNTISALSCLFFLAADYIWLDNIILTETPFILSFALLFYFSFKIAMCEKEKQTWKYFIGILITFIFSLFIRPNIAIFPLFLFIFLLLNKYDFKLLVKQGFIALIALLLVLTPWIYRNYKVFNKFIPLTYGMGNPLLLGTYEGYNYPSDEELDYDKNVYNKMSKEMKYYIENVEEKPHMTKYYQLKQDEMKAKYRMQEWWKKDKIAMLKSYLYFKPKEMLFSAFYWQEILGIKTSWVLLTRKIDIILFIISVISIIIDKKRLKELLFLLLVYGSQIVIYSYSFAFSRYAISLFFIRYIVIGMGLAIIWSYIKKKISKRSKI